MEQTTETRDWTAEPDYNATDDLAYVSDPITLGLFATLPHSSLSLVWFQGGGYVHIGRPFIPGGKLTRVTNPEYGYAATAGEFKVLAARFTAKTE